MARALYNAKQTLVSTICQMLKVSRSTFYKYVREMASDQQSTAGV